MSNFNVIAASGLTMCGDCTYYIASSSCYRFTDLQFPAALLLPLLHFPLPREENCECCAGPNILLPLHEPQPTNVSACSSHNHSFSHRSCCYHNSFYNSHTLTGGCTGIQLLYIGNVAAPACSSFCCRLPSQFVQKLLCCGWCPQTRSHGLTLADKYEMEQELAQHVSNSATEKHNNQQCLTLYALPPTTVLSTMITSPLFLSKVTTRIPAKEPPCAEFGAKI